MASAPTVSEAIHRYLRVIPNAASHKQYRSRLSFLDRRLGHYKIKSVTPAVLFDYLYGDEGELIGSSRARGNAHRAAIQGWLRYCADRMWLPYIKVPKPPYREYDYARDWTYLSGSEMLAIQHAAPNGRLRVVVAVAANTALRIEDILAIERKNVRLDRGELRVWIQKSRVWDTKPITYDLAEVLEKALADHPGGRYLIPGFRATGLNQRGGSYVADYDKPASYNWAQDSLKETIAKAGIEVAEQECWHMIRRSVARRFFDRQVAAADGYDHALRLTQAMLNHKNQATTERYLGLRREYEARNESLRGVRFLS